MTDEAVDHILAWVVAAVDNDDVAWLELDDGSPFLCWVDDEPESYLAVWARQGDAEGFAAGLDDAATVRTRRASALEQLLDELGVAGVSVGSEWLVARLAALSLLSQRRHDAAFQAALGPHEDVIVGRADGSCDWRLRSVPVLTGGFDFDDVVSVRIDDVLGLTVKTVQRAATRLRVRFAAAPTGDAAEEHELHRRLLAIAPSEGELVERVGQAVSYAECGDAVVERVEAFVAGFSWPCERYEIGRGDRLDDMLADACRERGAGAVAGTLAR